MPIGPRGDPTDRTTVARKDRLTANSIGVVDVDLEHHEALTRLLVLDPEIGGTANEFRLVQLDQSIEANFLRPVLGRVFATPAAITLLDSQTEQRAAADGPNAEVGPGAHFLSSAHTQANYRDAFYLSTTADNSSYEQWLADGSRDAMKRANAEWKSLLERYEDPGLDPAIDEALQAFIAERKASMPDRSYI